MLFTFKYFNYLLSDVKSGDFIVSINLFIILFLFSIGPQYCKYHL